MTYSSSLSAAFFCTTTTHSPSVIIKTNDNLNQQPSSVLSTSTKITGASV